MNNQILIDYLQITQTENIYTLAFEYAVNEQWELLTLVTVELSKRQHEDNTLTKYTTQHLKGTTNEQKSNPDK